MATEVEGAIGYSIIQYNDLLLAQQKRQNDVRETTLLATDRQRSVLQTIRPNQQRQAIAYSPHGHSRVENGLTSLLGFNGERLDPLTGHYLLGNGYRAFNPALMRFNGTDSLSPFDKGGLNSYVYCAADPINQSDPTGHFTTKLSPALTFMYETKTTTNYKFTNFTSNFMGLHETEYMLSTPNFPTITPPVSTSAIDTLQSLALESLGTGRAIELISSGKVSSALLYEPLTQKLLSLPEIIDYRSSLLVSKRSDYASSVRIETYREGLRGEIPGITPEVTSKAIRGDVVNRGFLERIFPQIFNISPAPMDLSRVIRKGYR